MNKLLTTITSLLLIVMVSGQRSPYAGRRPTGYKDRFTNTQNSIDTQNQDGVGNRFGEDQPSSTTQRLPYDAYGDAQLINRLNQRPVDQRPFWLINFEAIEAHRNASSATAQFNNRFGPQDNQGPQQGLPQQQGIQQQQGIPQQQGITNQFDNRFNLEQGPPQSGRPTNFQNIVTISPDVLNTIIAQSQLQTAQQVPQQFQNSNQNINLAQPSNRPSVIGFGVPQGNRGSFAGGK